jgi:hypothetical protein
MADKAVLETQMSMCVTHLAFIEKEKREWEEITQEGIEKN